MVDHNSQDYFRAYRRFVAGYLPNTGGWLEQSAKFNDVIDIIESELAAIRQEEEDNVKQRTRNNLKAER